MPLTHVCAIVTWSSWEWASRIAASLQAGLTASRGTPWEVAVLDGHRTGRSLYSVYIIEAVGIEQVARLAQESLARGTADWVVVDCTLENLDTACRAVQALPRWPLAWLPPPHVASPEGALQTLAARVVRRLEVVSARAHEPPWSGPLTGPPTAAPDRALPRAVGASQSAWTAAMGATPV